MTEEEIWKTNYGRFSALLDENDVLGEAIETTLNAVFGEPAKWPDDVMDDVVAYLERAFEQAYFDWMVERPDRLNTLLTESELAVLVLHGEREARSAIPAAIRAAQSRIGTMTKKELPSWGFSIGERAPRYERYPAACGGGVLTPFKDINACTNNFTRKGNMTCGFFSR
jgi:hypothetical protein